MKMMETLDTVKSKERFFGAIANECLKRGFFIVRYYVGKEPRTLFAHRSQVLPGSVRPEVGGKVTFAIGVDAIKGREQAIEIQVFPKE
jgi:hypothetical protein